MIKTLKGYFWWTHPRGNIHYDVMVTLILAFLFVSPRFIDFKDRPAPAVPLSSSQVLVKSVVTSGDTARFVYEVRVEDLHGAATDADLRTALLQVIEPISGGVTLLKYTPVLDTHGHTVAYDATVVH